jgi:hypothetical protein
MSFDLSRFSATAQLLPIYRITPESWAQELKTQEHLDKLKNGAENASTRPSKASVFRPSHALQ